MWHIAHHRNHQHRHCRRTRPGYRVDVTLYQQELARCGIDQQTSARQAGRSAQLPLKEPHPCEMVITCGHGDRASAEDIVVIAAVPDESATEPNAVPLL